MDKKLALYLRAIQPSLFPGFEQEIGAQTPQHGRLQVVIDWVEIEKFSDDQLPARGRPRQPSTYECVNALQLSEYSLA